MYLCKRNMGKTVTTYLIDGDPKGIQFVFIGNMKK